MPEKPDRTHNNGYSENDRPNGQESRKDYPSKLKRDLKGPALPSIGKQDNGYNSNLGNQTGKQVGNQALKKGATEVAKKIPGVGLLAHTPIGKKAIEKTVDAATNVINDMGQDSEDGLPNPTALPFIGKKKNPIQKLFGSNDKEKGKAETDGGIGEILLKLKKYGPIISAIATPIIIFLVLIMSAVMIYKLSPLYAIGEKMNTFFDSAGQHFGNLFTGCGWTSDTECNENEKNKFLDEIQNIYNTYSTKYGVRLNTSLLTATLTYTDINDINLDDFDMEDFENSGFDAGDYRNMKKNISSLANHMAPEKEIEQEDEDGNIEIVIIRELDLDAYREYLETEFIEKMYLQGYTGNTGAKIKEIIDDIYARVEFFEGLLADNSSRFDGVYSSCREVVIEGGEYSGTYSLEDYVAGVVQAEGSILGDEAQKALAIAARGYVISVTDNCKNPIGNSSAQQNFVTPTNSRVMINVAQTAGLVLTIDGEIFSSEYDSFYTNTDTDENGAGGFYCDDTYCYVNYYKKGAGWDKSNWQVHQVKILKEYGYIGGHGRGLSQWGAHYLDTVEGYDYKQILAYFYDDKAKIQFLAGNSENVACNSNPTVIDTANKSLLMKIDKAGWCTRQSVVEAATFLAYEYYHVPYFWGGKYAVGGVNPNWGCPKIIGSSGASHQPEGSLFPLGLDCSGFIAWAVTNGGYYFPGNYGQDELYSRRGASDSILFASSQFMFEQVQAGDLVTMPGHIGMVISVNRNNQTFTVAHSAGSTGMTTTVLDRYGKFVEGKNSGFTGIVYMDGFYNSISTSNPNSGDVSCKKWGS